MFKNTVQTLKQDSIATIYCSTIKRSESEWTGKRN